MQNVSDLVILVQREHFPNALLSSAFYDNLSAVFERLASYSCPVVVCGDFNVHFDQTDDVNAARLDQLLQSFGYVQHVSEPTHTMPGTLSTSLSPGLT